MEILVQQIPTPYFDFYKIGILIYGLNVKTNKDIST